MTTRLSLLTFYCLVVSVSSFVSSEWKFVGKTPPVEYTSLTNKDFHMYATAKELFFIDTSQASLWTSNDLGMSWKNMETAPWCARHAAYSGLLNNKLLLAGGLHQWETRFDLASS